MLPLLATPLILALAGGSMVQESLRAIAAQAAVAIERQRQLRSASDAPAYIAAAREVSNWRREAVQDLQPTPLSALAVLLQVERPVVTRCVKLNNYWCIKRARWNGEIGSDDEGHTGFATAGEGADAAVTLLRRYYLQFGRRSALDIVRRWAPAECRGGPSVISLPVLALRGIGMTLRARWLAAQRGKAVPAKRTRLASAASAAPGGPAASAAHRSAAPARVSVVPLRPLPTFRVPDIAVGLGERRATTFSATLAVAPRRHQPTPASVAAAQKLRSVKATQPRPAAAAPRIRVASTASTAAPRPAVRACTPDEARIHNYAARIVADLGLGPSEDLKLFEPDGTPLPNLPRVMLAMSSVELGMLRASLELIENAIARARPQAQANASLRPVEAAPAP